MKKLSKEVFIEADEKQKQKIIDLVINLDSHNSISKDVLIEIIKYQNVRIKEMEDYIKDEVNRVEPTIGYYRSRGI